MTVQTGHVVNLRRGGVGIVFSMSAQDAWIVPVWGCNGPPRHRSEVVIEDMMEIASCGFGIRYPVARCHQAFKTSRAKLRETIGAAPKSLMSRIVASLRREAESQAFERSRQYAGHSERCVFLT